MIIFLIVISGKIDRLIRFSVPLEALEVNKPPEVTPALLSKVFQPASCLNLILFATCSAIKFITTLLLNYL